MRILSLFSGIGAFEKALTRLEIDFELINYCEIDKCASKAYSIIHGVDESKNLGDITKVNVDNIPDVDLITYGFPCQDISVAGKQAGIKPGTRSGLYYEAYRIIKAKLPKYAICENVKNLTGKKFKAQFEIILQDLEQLGYTNYWKVLNAKDYGIPQNRERVFIISIRGEHKPYEFPKPFENGLRLKDMLEDRVDEKYYINQEKVEKLIGQLHKADVEHSHSICASIGRTTEREYFKKNQGQLVGEVIACLTPDRAKKQQNGRRFKQDGEPMFTLTGQDKHGVLTTSEYVNKKYEEFYFEHGYYPELFNPYNKTELNATAPTLTAQGDSITKSGTILKLEKIGSIGSDSQGNRVYSTDGIAAAQCGEAGGLGAKTGLYYTNYRIRKLTPKECWRLMGFDDTDIDKCINAGISNTQLYKMAGNSIVVDILEVVFIKLLHHRRKSSEQNR